jgi:glycerol kinase
MYARGLIIGLERGTTRAHIARATLESIAYQTRDLVEAMRAAGQRIDVLRADGGGTVNRFLMQFQADLLGIPVEVAAIRETTALGAAFLAGLAVGVWKTPDELRKRRAISARYEPKMPRDQREHLYVEWQRAVERSRGWATPPAASP